MQKLTTLFIALLYSGILVAQVEEGRRVTEKLCSEAFFGRGYTKGGDSLAALFLAQTFAEKGVKPLKKNYFQSFEMPVNTFPGEMSLTINGQRLETGKDFIVHENSGSANLTWNFRNIPAKELLDVRLVRKLMDEIQAAKNNGVCIDFSGLKGDSLNAARRVSYSLTDKVNVLALTDEKFTFSVGREPFKHAYLLVQKSVVGDLVSIECTVESLFKQRHVTQNVLAKIPGKNKKKCIVFTAHYDHLGGMGRDTYFPGANDNASGTSMLMALADYYLVHKPKYTTVFMAFAGEEAGLLGSQYFVQHPELKLSSIRFLINLDIMGSGEEGITVVNGAVFPEEFDRLTQLNTENQFLTTIKKRGKAANSDHYFFTEAGVPSFFIYTMGPNKHYHDVFDTYDALSFSVYNQIVHLLTKFVDGF